MNESIKAKLSLPQLSGSVYYDELAKLLPKHLNDSSSTQPCIVSNEGDGKWVGPDDVSPLTIYHRVLGISTDVDEKSYGDSSILIENIEMTLVVFSNRKKLKIIPEDLYSAIQSGLLTKFEKAFLEELKLRSLQVGSSRPNMEPVDVFQREFSRSKYPLKPETNYFCIDYDLVIKYDSDCFDLKDCNCS